MALVPSTPSRRTALAIASCALALAGAVGALPAAASSAPLRFGPATSPIHPGIALTISGVTCRVGAVVTDGRSAYLAVPASCTGVSGGQATNGCRESQVPLGLPVTVPGARYRGTYVYSSFVEMQLHSDASAARCADNSLSLVRLDPRDVARTTPVIPSYGGPTGVASGSSSLGQDLDVLLSAPTSAVAMAGADSGWSQPFVASASVAAADRGAPVLDPAGRLVGLLTLVPSAPMGRSYASSFADELAYLRATALPGARLATAPLNG